MNYETIIAALGDDYEFEHVDMGVSKPRGQADLPALVQELDADVRQSPVGALKDLASEADTTRSALRSRRTATQPVCSAGRGTTSGARPSTRSWTVTAGSPVTT